MSLQSFPPNVLVEIGTYLSDQDWASFSKSCRAVYESKNTPYGKHRHFQRMVVKLGGIGCLVMVKYPFLFVPLLIELESKGKLKGDALNLRDMIEYSDINKISVRNRVYTAPYFIKS